MFNKTLNRPMFRRGGRAGGGIMTGVERQGYAGDDGASSVQQNDPMKKKIDSVGGNVEAFNKAFPKYNNMGSDFFMGLGANILAQPGGQPILQTIGTAAKEPLNIMMKQNMSNTQGDRELALAMWKNMDEDTKTRMMKDAQYLVDQGVFPNIQEALKSEIYSKQKSPLAKKEARIKELENIIISKDVGGSLTEVAQDIANHVYNIQTGVYDGAVDQNGNPLSFAKQKSYFKDGDVSRQGTKEDGTMIYELTENGKNKYEAYEGEVVFDYRTGKLFKKQGTMLVEVTIGEKQIEE
mgnify:FL=1|jgi:hypothetical protein